MNKILILNGKKSIGTACLKDSPNNPIFAFRIWGKLYWCGDGENLRATKKEAYSDTRKEK